MELTFNQAKEIGKHEYNDKYPKNTYHIISLCVMLVIFVLSCIFYVCNSTPTRYIYETPDNNEIYIEDGSLYTTDSKLIPKEVIKDDTNWGLFSIIALSAIGVGLIMIIYDSNRSKYAEEYAIYYLLNKKLRED